MAGRQPDTVHYEDFQPKSEEKEEKGARLLFVYLPDFSEDQIRVTYVHSTCSLTVRGQRSLGNNKWSRFNRTFSVSQNCIVDKIHAVFQFGILTITIPNQTTSPPQPTASSLNGEGQWFVETSHMNISLRDYIEQLNSTAHQKTYPASQTLQKPITEPKVQNGQVQIETYAKETPKQSIQSDNGNTKGEQKRIDALTPSKAPHEFILQKQDETSPAKETEKTTEKQRTSESETISIQKSERSTETGAPKGLKKKGDEVKEEISFIEKAKEMKNVAAAAIKTTLEKTEDGQLLVNMGVAVLMIMAVGAYVTYST